MFALFFSILYNKKGEKMKIVFFGTPEFSATILKELIKSKHEIIAVVTQEDKKVGRKQILTSPPAKIVAEENNIQVFQFKKLRTDGVETLRSLNADVFVTASYGQIISQEILDMPKYCTLNVHGSLLPKYRGASPVQWCLINGETETGITIMRTDAGIDTGDMFISEKVEIDKTDNAETLFDKLAKISTPLLLKTLEMLENGTIEFKKQPENFTYFPMLKKEDGKIDFNKSADEIVNLVRGLYIWPNAYFYYDNKMIKIYKAESVNLNFENASNGEIVCASTKQGLIIKCSKGYLKILELQIEGGKRLDYKSFLNGNKLEVNKVL